MRDDTETTTLKVPSGIEAVIDFAKEAVGGQNIRLDGLPNGLPDLPVLLHPVNQTRVDIVSLVDAWRNLQDKHADRPRRRSGTATLYDLASFIAHFNRHKDDNSVVFADRDRKAPRLLGVLDYNEALNVSTSIENEETGEVTTTVQHISGAQPRFGVHRSEYQFPLSDEWKAWVGKNGQGMNQSEFAQFLEDHILDVLPPPTQVVSIAKRIDDGSAQRSAGGDFGQKSADELLAELLINLGTEIAGPSRMMELSRGLEAFAGHKVEGKVDLQGGANRVVFVEEHKDATGQPLVIPGVFLIGIPVFERGAPYRIAVRLRYRIRSGAMTWFFEMHQHLKVFDHAFAEAARKVADDTGRPVFLGKPEA